MQFPKRLSDYPWVVVNISCKLCARRGRYRLARLAARYGSEQTLDGLLADLAHTCPYWRTNPRSYEPRCGARFEDLDRLRPHDVPGAPRERPPSRESLPQRRPRSLPVPGQGPVLSSWEHESIALVCGKCGRREAYEVTAMIATMGDVPLTTVHTTLTAACPRAVKQDFSDWCGARFDAG